MSDVEILLTVVLAFWIGLIGLIFLFASLWNMKRLLWSGILLIPAIILFIIAIINPAIPVADTLNSGFWLLVIGIGWWTEAVIIAILSIYHVAFTSDMMLRNIVIVVLLFSGGVQIILATMLIYSDVILFPFPVP